MLTPVLTLAAAGTAAGLLYAGAPSVYRTLQRRALRRGGRGRLVLTYDDGPDEEVTPAVARLLHERGVRATFFLVGSRAEEFPEVCDEVAELAHEIGTHTWSHRSAWRQGPVRAVREVGRGYEALRRWVEPDGLFRPPFGKMTALTLASVLRRGSVPVWWTVDGGDTWPVLPDPGLIVERVVQAEGGVVLLHSRHVERWRRPFLFEVTQRLLDEADRRGWRTSTVSEALTAACGGAALGARARRSRPKLSAEAVASEPAGGSR